MSAPQVFSPASRTIPPLPKWTLVALAAGVLLAALTHFVLPGAGLVRVICTLPGVLGAIGLGAWLEEAVYVRILRLAPAPRLVACLVWPPLALVAGLVASGLVGGVGTFVLRDSTSGLVAFVTAAWVALAAVGSAVVLVLDVLISASVRDLRSRIVLAVLALVGLMSAIAAGLAGFLRSLVANALSQGQLWLDDSDAGARLSFNNGDARGPNATLATADTTGELVAIFAVLFVLLALPAIMSALGKLAEAVMERVHPLSLAFEAMQAGSLDVRVEEGGSREFVQLNRSFNATVDALAKARRMELAFGAYVSRQLVGRIRAQHGEALLPASQHEATVLFADIRGFTSMSEKLKPAEVLALLNRYFSRVVELVEQHDGYLNKFIGDAVVVVWNGPVEQGDHAARGVACAIAIQQEVAALNAAGAFPEIGALHVGIGVATGPVVAGNLGSARQMEYTVIGDTVNLASRLTGQAPAGEVWVNEAAARQVAPALPTCPLPSIKVKGREQQVVPHRAWPRST